MFILKIVGEGYYMGRGIKPGSFLLHYDPIHAVKYKSKERLRKELEDIIKQNPCMIENYPADNQ